MALHAVGRPSDIPVGGKKLFTIGGRPIAVFNVKGEYFAILNRCPHQGASLCDGALTGLVTSDRPGECSLSRPGEIVRCPWHGWDFDLRTGESWFDPTNTKLRKYAAGVTSGAELVKGPYKAETFKVSTEEDYLVVEL
jgi:nitrite reductase/ring-hydroxylating ferredoxin subunit